ncbi:MAG: thioredoxin domain-containing protein [Allosphingosinicella sp.]|uniref:thioredoxin domain-containing protein n=1 Tax=Allosphingosinicella sp. TaxID=2823234 RepID=UPI00395E127A
MKIKVSVAAMALVLALGACGGGDGNGGTAAVGSEQLQLEPIAAPNNGDWTEVVERTDEGGFRMGNPDARVKLVEFASMTCPACASFSGAASESLKNDYIRTGHVSLEFRNFVRDPADATASLLARCQSPAAFFRFTEQLFAEQSSWMGNMTEQEANAIQAMPPERQVPALAAALELDQFFRRRGVPEAEVNACLSNQQELARLADLTRVANERHGVAATPSFLLNGELLETGADWPRLEARIRGALAR